MITIPPRHYCVIENPVIRDKDGKVTFDDDIGQVKLAFADLDFRFAKDPFPLYPGEVLKQVRNYNYPASKF
jgi:major vault protein